MVVVVIYCWWLYEAAKMLFAQPTDSISHSEFPVY